MTAGGGATRRRLFISGTVVEPRHRSSSLASWLADVRDDLPRALVPSASFARLEAAARALPRALTDWVYFESRLGAAAARVDLILRVGPHGRRALRAGLVPRVGGAGTAADGWRRAVRIVREAPAGWIDQLWLEFDSAIDGSPPARAVAAPGVFVDLSQRPDGPGTLGLPALAGLLVPADGAAVRTLRRCVAHLPPGAGVPYLGSFPHRAPDVLRLCCRRVGPGDLEVFLSRAGWPGDVGGVRRLMDALGGEARSAWSRGGVVHLDAGRGVGPRLGLEYPLARGPQWTGALAEQDLLRRLVDQGLCTERQRLALLRWPGCRLERRRHGSGPSVLVRRVNHLKLQIEPGRDALAKAYGCLYRARLESRRGSMTVDRPLVSGAERDRNGASAPAFSRDCAAGGSGHVACQLRPGVPQRRATAQEPT